MIELDPVLITLLWGAGAGMLFVSIGLFVWYAIALSRLFPRLGGEGWRGWVPVLNEAEIFTRGGIPGWAVVFYFIPLVQFYGLYLKIVAVHRINVRFRRGAGLTVLGILLPPLWATLLAQAGEPIAEEAKPRAASVRTVSEPRRTPLARDASGYAIPIPAPIESTLIDEVPIDRELPPADPTPSPVPSHASSPAPAPPSWRIVLDDGAGFALTASRVVLGRSPAGGPDEQTLAVPDATRTLSKTHARLEFDDAGWHLTDLNSTNGSRVVAADGLSELTPGVRVAFSAAFQLGDVGMRIVQQP
ncbi:DUF5684 domain-containing protein [Microbacterium sp.]|uniref:DUF5684 domain-containing protein n=1 Tax=Microbacterium sp. TaxID=51671 RepID=UPI003F9C5849